MHEEERPWCRVSFTKNGTVWYHFILYYSFIVDSTIISNIRHWTLAQILQKIPRWEEKPQNRVFIESYIAAWRISHYGIVANERATGKKVVACFLESDHITVQNTHISIRFFKLSTGKRMRLSWSLRVRVHTWRTCTTSALSTNKALSEKQNSR